MKTLIATALFAVSALIIPTDAEAKRCVVAVPIQGLQMLVNTCAQCKVVKISRARPGGGQASRRTYAVPARSKIELNFKGPGQTRVESEGPCRSKTAPAQKAATSSTPQCIGFTRLKTGKSVLKNNCQTCRQAVIDFHFPSAPVRREKYAIAGHAYSPLKNHPGATDVYIRSEGVCRGR